MKSVRTKVSGQRQAINALKQAIGDVLEKDVSRYVEITLQQRLATNENADGSPRPQSAFTSKDGKVSASPGEKSPRTVAAYKRKGLDTEHYLVATGKATELKHKVSGTRLTVEPATPSGRKILAFHMDGDQYPHGQWRGLIRWFELNEQESININRRVTNGLHRHGY